MFSRFTNSNGTSLYLLTEEIVLVTGDPTFNWPGAKAELMISTQQRFCVKESPEECMEIINSYVP